MKNVTFLGAAAVALMAAMPAHAAGGYVGGVYGNVDIDGAGSSDIYGVEGAYAGANFEVDLSVLDAQDADTSVSAAGHLFQRTDSHLFGGFIGLNNDSDTTTWSIGAEANKYFDQFTLAGAIAYADNSDADVNGYGVNGEARFFLTENMRLQGNLGWVNVDAGGGADADAWSYGLGGEYQFDATPISLGLGWNRIDADGGNADTVKFTVRYNLGGTLRERDRTGASQADLTGLGLTF